MYINRTAAGWSSVLFKYQIILSAVDDVFSKYIFSVSLHKNQVTVGSVDEVNEAITISIQEKSIATFEEKNRLVISPYSIGNCLIDLSSWFNYKDLRSSKNNVVGNYL